MIQFQRLHCLTAGLLVCILLPGTIAQQPVEPLLQQYCLGCHNDAEHEAGLSLQTPDALKRGGDNGPVFDARMPEASLLLKVLSEGAENAMPPEGEAQPSADERRRLIEWVRSGARFKPMAAGRPSVPEVKPFHKVAPSLLASTLIEKNVVAVGGGRHVAAIDTSTKQERWRISFDDRRVTALSTAATKPWVVAATGLPGVFGKAVLMSTETGEVEKEFGGHTDMIYAAVLNHDASLLATAGYDRRILLHDVASGKTVRSLDGHNGSVFSLAFDPSGTVLCSASADGTVKVWNAGTGQRLDTLSQPTSEQYSVVVAGGGRLIFAAGADNRIRIWKLLSLDKARINPIQMARFAHERPITRLAVSADGTRLASAAEDGTVRVWQTSPFQYHRGFSKQKSAVTSLTFIDNRSLLVTHIDGTWQVLAVAETSAVNEDIVHKQNTAPPSVLLAGELKKVSEHGANNEPAVAQKVQLPAKISGVIAPDGGNDRDVDCFVFSASAGQQLVLEVNAARIQSPLDSKIEVLTADGEPIVRTLLQAVRDSYFTFRGKDSNTSNDFRLFNWQEMELNEFLYSDGEVVKLWHYPRGPDSGYIVYPGFGSRFTYFDTTPTTHALQAPCFIVVPRRPGETLTPNGLPVFSVHFENDDDARRELGRDSRLHFTAPADGNYVVRMTDARSFSGPDFKYELTIRSPQPDFEVSVNTRKVAVAEDTGQEVVFTARRIDGFDGPVKIDVTGLPEGFSFSGPVTIQREQLRAMGTFFARAGAHEPTAEELSQIRFRAVTDEHGERDLGGIEELKLTMDPKLKVKIHAFAAADENAALNPEPPVLSVRPGETIRARVIVERLNHKGVVSFGKEDSGRNLPHGVYVDNIGLNGLLLLADQTDREFFITASKIASPGTYTFYLKSNVDQITSQSVVLQVLPADGSDDKVTAR